MREGGRERESKKHDDYMGTADRGNHKNYVNINLSFPLKLAQLTEDEREKINYMQ